ncbi:MAG: KpsF/GutQ family sugar-phosphate isomerase [Candidatus Methylopumilus sp.]|nr:KpsF/GutQ family sugar-phosphate isomerase [Candidatus Methylopumilus sp.]
MKNTSQNNEQAQNSLQIAQRVLQIEAEAVLQLAQRLDVCFNQATSLILQCQGRVVVSGMGKSGHIGNKIASTFASTGTPAFFMHPAEASHGDLGMMTAQDVMLAISNSGESDELLAIMPALKRLGVKIVAMSSNPDSSLAKQADVHLDVSVEREACPLGLAPTASSTASLALGDAIAIAVLEARGFSAEDFARAHPGGNLGRRLLRIQDIMRKGPEIPQVSQDATLQDALLEISRKGLGMTAITQGSQVLGIFTDGDLRRALENSGDILQNPIADMMQRSPLKVRPEDLALHAVQLMEQNKINALLVENQQGELVGAINMHDLLLAKVV